MEVLTYSPVAVFLVLIVVGVPIYVFRTWIIQRVKQSIIHDYAQDLESHKDEIGRLTTRLHAVQSTANAALIEGQRVSAEWRIKAADALWREVLRLRNESPSVLTMLDVLAPGEYQKFVTDEDFRSLVPDMTEVSQIYGNFEEIEHVRPFLGERLFTLFFIYRAVNGRICFLLVRDVKKGRVTPWYVDNGIHRLLNEVLTPEEFSQFSNLPGRHVRWVRSLIEGKILDHLRRVIAGEISTTEGLEQARKVQEIMQAIESEDSRK